jgi:hypothetical protein
LQRQRRREKKKEDADSFSAPFLLVVDPCALAVSSHALQSSHSSKRNSLLALTASILLFLLVRSTTFSRSDSNGTGGAALLLSRRSSVVAASRTYSAAFSWSLSGRKGREKDSLRHDTKRLKRRVRGEEAHDASSKRSPASMRTSAAAADDADLRLLRSRIFRKQPPTDDTTPQGPRRERVMPARAAVVSAELEYRRRARQSATKSSMDGDGQSPLSPLSRSLFPSEPLSPLDPDYVAACVVLRDQKVDLPEFIAWHAALGIRTFYLYDHGSSPPVSAEEAASLLSWTSTENETMREKQETEMETEARMARMTSTAIKETNANNTSTFSSSSFTSSSGVSIHVTPLTEEQINAHPTLLPQMTGYDFCIEANRANHAWLAFFDVDEFVVITDVGSSLSSATIPDTAHDRANAASANADADVTAIAAETAANAASATLSSSSSSPSEATTSSETLLRLLPLLLSKYEGAAAALALHWKVFGSGGRASRKPDSQLTAEAFEDCVPSEDGDNWTVKTIASTRLLDVAEPCLGPHHFSYWDFEGAADAAEEAEKRQSEGTALSSSSSFSPRPQPFAVDVTGSRIDGPLARASSDGAPPKVPHFPAFLAHYVLKSKEEYQSKMLRGSGMRNHKPWTFFEEIDGHSTEKCVEAKKLARVMKASGMVRLPGAGK